MIEQFGLGVYLGATDRMSGALLGATKNFAKLKMEAGKTAKEVQAEVKKMEAALDKYRVGFKTSLGLMVSGAALAAPFLLAGKAAAEFDHQFKPLRLHYAAFGDELSEIEKKVKLVKDAIMQMATESDVPLQDITQLGVQLVKRMGDAEGLKALPSATRLMDMGANDPESLARSMKILEDTYRMGAGEIEDIVAQLTQSTGADLNEMLALLTASAGDASLLGTNLRENAALLQLFSQRGRGGMRTLSSLNELKSGLEQYNQMIEEQKKKKLSLTDMADQTAAGTRSGNLPLSITFLDKNGRYLPWFEIGDQIRKQFGRAKDSLQPLSAEQGRRLREAFGPQAAEWMSYIVMNLDKLRKDAAHIGVPGIGAAMTEKSDDQTEKWAVIGNDLRVAALALGGPIAAKWEVISNQMAKAATGMAQGAKDHSWISSIGSSIGFGISSALTLVGGTAAVGWILKFMRSGLSTLGISGSLASLLKVTGWIGLIITTLDLYITHFDYLREKFEWVMDRIMRAADWLAEYSGFNALRQWLGLSVTVDERRPGQAPVDSQGRRQWPSLGEGPGNLSMPEPAAAPPVSPAPLPAGAPMTWDYSTNRNVFNLKMPKGADTTAFARAVVGQLQQAKLADSSGRF